MKTVNLAECDELPLFEGLQIFNLDIIFQNFMYLKSAISTSSLFVVCCKLSRRNDASGLSAITDSILVDQLCTSSNDLDHFAHMKSMAYNLRSLKL